MSALFYLAIAAGAEVGGSVGPKIHLSHSKYLYMWMDYGLAGWWFQTLYIFHIG